MQHGGLDGGACLRADRQERQPDLLLAAPEQRKPVLAAEKRAVEIDRKNLPPRGEIGLFDVAQSGEARGVDQPIETIVGFADLGDHA